MKSISNYADLKRSFLDAFIVSYFVALRGICLNPRVDVYV